MRLGLLQRNHQPYQELGNQMSHSFPATLLATTLLLAASAAHSQAPAAQHVSTGIDASDDSDGFREYKPWAQYEAANSWGLRAAWQHYSINNWSTTGRSLYLTHRAQQGAWSSNGRVGLNRSAAHSHIVGAWDGMYQFTAQTAAGMSVERDVVNSQRGLERGLTATTAVAVLDHQLHPRLSLGLAAGSTWFSDDNRRDVLRSRWTFTLHEPQGWYAYAITRHYQNSKPYQGAYFAPERFREATLGLLWKKAVSDHLVISAKPTGAANTLKAKASACGTGACTSPLHTVLPSSGKSVSAAAKTTPPASMAVTPATATPARWPIYAFRFRRAPGAVPPRGVFTATLIRLLTPQRWCFR